MEKELSIEDIKRAILTEFKDQLKKDPKENEKIKEYKINDHISILF